MEPAKKTRGEQRAVTALASAGLGLAAGFPAGLAYAFPWLAPLFFVAVFLGALGLLSRFPRGTLNRGFFALAVSAAWVGPLIGAHAFAPIPLASVMLYGILVGAVLLFLASLIFKLGSTPSVLVAASVAGGLDWVCGWALTGSALSPAAMFWRFPVLMLPASAVGCAGWTFLVVLSAGSLAVLVRSRSTRERIVAGALAVFPVLPSVITALCVSPPGVEIVACAAQSGNYGPGIDAVRRQTGDAADAGASLVVWPEMTFSLSPLDRPWMRDILAGAASERRITLLVPFLEDRTDLNRLVVFGPEGNVLGTATKRNPAWVVGEDSRAGYEPGVMETPFGTLGTCICYDAYFPGLVRGLVAEGASLLAVPALSLNEAGAMRYAPMLAVLRAVETGVPVVWCEPKASSMVVDARGRILARSGEGRRNVIARVYTRPRGSVYVRTGGALGPILFILALAVGVAWALLAWLSPRGDRGKNPSK